MTSAPVPAVAHHSAGGRMSIVTRTVLLTAAVATMMPSRGSTQDEMPCTR